MNVDGENVSYGHPYRPGDEQFGFPTISAIPAGTKEALWLGLAGLVLVLIVKRKEIFK